MNPLLACSCFHTLQFSCLFLQLVRAWVAVKMEIVRNVHIAILLEKSDLDKKNITMFVNQFGLIWTLIQKLLEQFVTLNLQT